MFFLRVAASSNVAQQDCNWTGGKVGEGSLFQGLRKNTVDFAQPINFVSDDPDEQRWFTLSNGEKIQDINGNIWQFVFDDVQGDENGRVARPFDENSPSLITPPFKRKTKGVGWFPIANSDWIGYALFRGGYWYSDAIAGVFALVGDDGGGYVNVGFRCTKML